MKNLNKRAWRLYWLLQTICVLAIALTVSAHHSVTVQTMLQSILPATAFSYTYDAATPLGTDAPSTIDDQIRRTRYAIQERLNVDHYFPLTGTQVSDTDAGYHRQIHFYSTTATDPILDFTTVGGVDELQYTDSTASAIQLTDTGGLNMALLTSQTITTPTLTSPVLNTGVSGTAVLDEDNMASDSATQLATQQSIKAYVDSIHSTYSGAESYTFPGGVIFKHGYIARSGSSTTVTFSASFSTGVVSCGVIAKASSPAGKDTLSPIVSSFGTSSMVIYSGNSVDGFYWQAWGY